MKKALLIFTAGVLLTGCGSAGPVSDIQTDNDTAAEAVTVPSTEALTEVTETSAVTTVPEKSASAPSASTVPSRCGADFPKDIRMFRARSRRSM